MANPTPYTRVYSQAGFQTTNPGDSLPGIHVDGELDAVAISIASLCNGLQDVRRSDGALKNGVVTADSLAPDVLMTSQLYTDILVQLAQVLGALASVQLSLNNKISINDPTALATALTGLPTAGLNAPGWNGDLLVKNSG